MAITPQEANQARLNEEALIKELETKIDDKLYNEHIMGETVTLYLDGGITPRVKAKVIQLYTDNGWSVVWESGTQHNETSHNVKFTAAKEA